MAKHVVSTLSADTRYTQWVNSSGINTRLRSVLVKGGAGVASKGRGDPVTPEGVVTQLSDEDAAFLTEHKQFKEHQAKGFVKIVKLQPRDPDTAAQSMEKDEGSRPKNPKDVETYAKQKDPSLQAVTNKK